MSDRQRRSARGSKKDPPIQPDRAVDSSSEEHGFRRAFFNDAYDAVMLLDESWNIVSINASTTRMFGCDEDQLVGTNLLQWIVERNRTRHFADVSALKDGTLESVMHGWADEASALRHDGSEFPVEVMKSKVAVSRKVLFAVTVRDISERRKAMSLLIESQAKLAAALANMRDAVCISDAQGRNLEFNDSFVRLCRFKSRQECNTTLAELHAGFDFTTVSGAPLPVKQRPIYRALNGDDGVGIDFKVSRKDTGETWTASYSFGPIRDEYGAITGAVITARDVTAERELLTQLKSSRSELRQLVAGQQLAEENERKRIAREVHDDLQQTLVALRLNVAAVEQQARTLSKEALVAASQAMALSDSALLSTRRMIRGLRPQVLDDFGLLEALSPMLVAFGDRAAIGWCVDVRGDAKAELPEETATCLYRIAQESLQNIEKHAQASAVYVVLDLSAPDRVVLQISDDGVGIQTTDFLKRQSYGLLGMEERVRALGGTLTITPGTVSGTMVEAAMPLTAGGGGGLTLRSLAAPLQGGATPNSLQPLDAAKPAPVAGFCFLEFSDPSHRAPAGAP